MWTIRGEIQRSPPPPPPIAISLTLTSPPPRSLHLLPWLSSSAVAVPLTHHYLMWWSERWGSKTSLTLLDLREMGRQTLVLSKTAVQIYGKFPYVHVCIYCVCACLCMCWCGLQTVLTALLLSPVPNWCLFFLYWGGLSIGQFVGTADLKSQLFYHFLLVLFLFLFCFVFKFPGNT